MDDVLASDPTGSLQSLPAIPSDSAASMLKKKKRSPSPSIPENTPKGSESSDKEMTPPTSRESSSGVFDDAKSATKWDVFAASMSFAAISYSQTNCCSGSGVFATPRVGYRHDFKGSRLSMGLNSFITAFPIYSRMPERSNIHFWGVNWRVGFPLITDSPVWGADMAFGSYYQNMFSSGNAYGYRNLFGPQALVRVSRALSLKRKNNQILSTYFKFAPMTDRVKVMNLENRELAVGLSWSGTIGSTPLTFGLDYAHLRFGRLLYEQNGIDRVQVKTLSLGVRWNFSVLDEY